MNLKKFRYLRIDADSLIYLMIFGMMSIQLSLPFKLSFLASLGTWSIFVSTIFAFLLRIRRTVDKRTISVVVMSIMVLVSMICSFAFSYQSVVAALSFLEIPLLVCAYPEVRNRKKIKKLLYICFAILSIFYISLSFTRLSHIFYTDYGENQMLFLTLGYNNPNETSIYLFTCLIVFIALLGEDITLFAKILSGVLIITLFILVQLTLSRTSMLLCMLYILLSLFFRKRKIPKVARIVALSLPVVFLLFTIVFNDFLDDWMLLGETIETGRLNIYRSFLDELNLWNFLFGNYSKYFSNLHNAFLTIFATTGVFCTSLYIGFLDGMFRHLSVVNSDNTGKFALLGLYCIIIYSSAESAFLTAGGAFAVMFISIYLLCITGQATDSQASVEIEENDIYNEVVLDEVR